jgi:mRNA interferase RelE/StbE
MKLRLPRRLRFDRDALKEFQRLDNSVKTQFKKKLAKLLSGQESPSPANALHGFPAGYYKIKLKKAGLRMVYFFDGKELIILVIAVGKRERNIVYEVAKSRLFEP